MKPFAFTISAKNLLPDKAGAASLRGWGIGGTPGLGPASFLHRTSKENKDWRNNPFPSLRKRLVPFQNLFTKVFHVFMILE